MSEATTTHERFLRTKEAALAFLATHKSINNRRLQGLAKLSRQQATRFFTRMVREGHLKREGRGSATRYVLSDSARVPSAFSPKVRPYERIACSLEALDGDRTTRMQTLVDTLWEALESTGVSWVGFYVHEGGDELVLGPRRDKPACSPIALHGACGQAFTTRKPIVVNDVVELGESYIACDPRDRSEVVVPLLDELDGCWGVLDLDSHETGAFDDSDVEGLQRVLVATGLTSVDPRPRR